MAGETSQFERNREWESLWMPDVLRLLRGTHFLCLAEETQDMLENSDLVVLRGGDVRVGVRMRRSQYFDRYKDEVTFRCSTPSGAKTEWAKIMEGWGDLFFYGIANPGWQFARSIRRWSLLNYEVVREIGNHAGQLLGKPIRNPDNTYFYALDVVKASRAFPSLVVDSNWSV